MQATETSHQTTTAVPATMQAAAIERFGGPEEIKVLELPVPRLDADEILIRVEAAGVGVWDPEERDGTLHQMLKVTPHFPLVLGSDGAGTVAAVGDRVTRFKVGDRVYAMSFMSPKGGFYAQYAAAKADHSSTIPANLNMDQTGVMPVDAITALRGLDDTLWLKQGESLLIFGASGGIGHLAVQLAKRMGARVLAVASGRDGVSLVKRLGADMAVDGKADDVGAAARQFARDGVDAALLAASGRGLDAVFAAVRDGGRIAYPRGVEPESQPRPGIRIEAYDGLPDPAVIDKLNHLIDAGPFEVQVAQMFTLDQAAEAHRALNQHHLGKLGIWPTR